MLVWRSWKRRSVEKQKLEARERSSSQSQLFSGTKWRITGSISRSFDRSSSICTCGVRASFRLGSSKGNKKLNAKKILINNPINELGSYGSRQLLIFQPSGILQFHYRQKSPRRITFDPIESYKVHPLVEDFSVARICRYNFWFHYGLSPSTADFWEYALSREGRSAAASLSGIRIIKGKTTVVETFHPVDLHSHEV